MTLSADISWKEQYGSAALNRKFYGVIPTGVYRGYSIQDAGNSAIIVNCEDSIAVVETNGMSLTIHGDGDEILTAPEGRWSLVIHAEYHIGQATTARLDLINVPLNEGQLEIALIQNSNGNLQITPRPRTSLRGGVASMDFGVLSLDLGEIGQQRSNVVLDQGWLPEPDQP
ncbi:MAG: hypothetical protein OIF57_06615 [Marinobacterium sp.]|nr:hypothetical protein [Marinobacterium sp.]